MNNVQSVVIGKTRTTKTIIFEEAIELFSRKGFNGVSIREITRQTGIKESSLYNHFTSKDDLLKNIFDYYQDIIVPALE